MKLDPSENIPTASSKSEHWIQWHKDLKKIFGKKKANSIWVFAWAQRGGVNSPANTNTLSKYMESQGVDPQRTTLEEMGESVSEFASGVFTFGKWVMIGGLILVSLILIRIIWKLTQNPNATIRTASGLAPTGRATKMIK